MGGPTALGTVRDERRDEAFSAHFAEPFFTAPGRAGVMMVRVVGRRGEAFPLCVCVVVRYSGAVVRDAGRGKEAIAHLRFPVCAPPAETHGLVGFGCSQLKCRPAVPGGARFCFACFHFTNYSTFHLFWCPFMHGLIETRYLLASYSNSDVEELLSLRFVWFSPTP